MRPFVERTRSRHHHHTPPPVNGSPSIPLSGQDSEVHGSLIRGWAWVAWAFVNCIRPCILREESLHEATTLILHQIKSYVFWLTCFGGQEEIDLSQTIIAVDGQYCPKYIYIYIYIYIIYFYIYIYIYIYMNCCCCCCCCCPCCGCCCCPAAADAAFPDAASDAAAPCCLWCWCCPCCKCCCSWCYPSDPINRSCQQQQLPTATTLDQQHGDRAGSEVHRCSRGNRDSIGCSDIWTTTACKIYDVCDNSNNFNNRSQ